MKNILFVLFIVISAVLPTAFAQTAPPSGSLTLTWTSNSASKETAFIVQRSIDGQSWSDIGRTGRNVTTYLDLPPLPDVAELSYRVRAIDEVNNLSSEYCAPATIKMTAAPTPTPKPTSLGKPTSLKGVRNP